MKQVSLSFKVFKWHGLTFGSLLESEDGRRLEAQVGLVVLGDLTNETLERKLADEQLRGFLVTTNFTKSDGSGPEAMGLLDTCGDGHGGLARSLGSELLARGLATGGLAGGLLLGGGVRSSEFECYVISCCEQWQ